MAWWRFGGVCNLRYDNRVSSVLQTHVEYSRQLKFFQRASNFPIFPLFRFSQLQTFHRVSGFHGVSVRLKWFEEDRRRFGIDWRIRGLEFLSRVRGIVEFRFKVFKRPSEFSFLALSHGWVKASRSLWYLKEGFEVLVWKSIEFADIFMIRIYHNL